jgi:hypothetical protein
VGQVGAKSEVPLTPLLRLASRVLRRTLPRDPARPSVLHGDVGAGNFMCENGRVTAMLDWEQAHVGDPHEDLAWLWMRGAHTSFGDPKVRLAEYEAASGRPLDRDRLDWQLTFVMWLSAMTMHIAVSQPSSESTLVHNIVLRTYNALLGAQLVTLLGGTFTLLRQPPVCSVTPETRLAERVLATPDLPKEARIIVTHLGDLAAQHPWDEAEFAADAHRLLGRGPGEVAALVDRAEGAQLGALAMTLARAADRAAHALPNAVRRIERAQRIGLGNSPERREDQ